MKCPHCGKEIADYSRFCEHCGGKVEQANPPAQAPKKKRGLKLLWRILGVLVSLFVLYVIFILIGEEMEEWHGMPFYLITCALLLLSSGIVYLLLIRPYCQYKTNRIIVSCILAANVLLDVVWFNVAVYTSIVPSQSIFRPYVVKLTIPKSTTSLEIGYLRWCHGLQEINVEDGNYVYSSRDGVLFDKRQTTLLVYPSAKKGEYIIPNGVTRIEGSAFSNCSGLTSVTIPNSVTSIGFGAFARCKSLTSVTIPNSVTSIEHTTFTECYSLTSVIIPNSVTHIGWYAFSECYSLTSVIIPNSVTRIDLCAFSECYNLSSVTIPSSVTSIGENAFKDVPQIIYNGSASGAPWGARDHLFEESFEAVAE